KQLYMKPLFILCHLNKQQGWKEKNLVPKFLIMSKEQLLSRYLQDA
ncbi:YkoP family protein, partial [Aneurinibacillus migulanus]